MIAQRQRKPIHWIFKLLIFLLAFYTLALMLSVPLDINIYNIMEQKGMILEEMTEPAPEMEYIVAVAHYFMQGIIIILVTFFMWKFLEGKSIRHLGLYSLKKHGKEGIIGLAGGVLAAVFVFAVLILSGNVKITPAEGGYNLLLSIIVSFLLYFIISFSEGVFNRGYVMSIMRTTGNVKLIFVASMAIFLLFYNGNQTPDVLTYINLFLSGGLYAYMFIKSGNLWMSMGFHMAWNFIMGGVFGFKSDGMILKSCFISSYKNENFINGGFYGPEGGIIVTITLITVFILVWWYYKDKSVSFIEYEEEIVLKEKSKKLKNTKKSR